MIIIDDQLLLRTYEIDDFNDLYAAINNSRRHLGPWLAWVAATTRPEHSLEFIQRSHHQIHVQEALVMGIFYNGTIIGGLGMHDWSHDTRRAQIGYWLCKEYEGKGIIGRSLKGFIGHLFSVAGLNKLEIHYVPANKRSAAVAQRLGFRLEGIIRQSVQRNGMTEDMVVTGLLKQEWKTAGN